MIFSWVASARIVGGRDAPFVQHQDPVAAAQQFRQFRTDQDDRLFRGGQLVDDAVDVLLGADVDAARRVVEEEHVGIDEQPSRQQHLLLIAAAQPG